MSALQGKNFTAVVDLRTRDGIVARAGERCDFVPVQSLDWLLRDGKIKADETAKPAKKAKA